MPFCFANRKPPTANRKPFVLILSLVMLWGCGPAATKPVVIFCSPDSPRLQQAVAGFREKLHDFPLKVVCAPQFGKEIETGLRQVRRLNPRLLVVLGTPALMQTAPVEKHTPVVFALVANPYFTGAAYRPGHPEDHQENVTGLASPPPLEAALKEGASLLGHRPWGLLYDPDDGVAAELAAKLTRLAPQFGLQPLLETSTGAATDRPALQRLYDRGARVLYLPPAASAARYAPLLLDWGRRKKVMVVSSYPEGSHQGAILWVALDYHKIGAATAALARRVLKGEAPKKIPIAEATPLRVKVDEKLVRHWSGYPGKPVSIGQ
jgi:ABC-type uncharacterized transport system substrate-binding protein